MKTLKEAIWEAAGWGSIFCSKCGHELERFDRPVVGNNYIICLNPDCNKPENRPCWEDND